MRALLAAPTPLMFWREKRGWSVESFAARIDIGEQHLRDAEAGTGQAPLSLYRKATIALGITLDDLAAE